MKTNSLILMLALSAALAFTASPTHAQLYVTTVNNDVGEYNATTGATINSTLVTGQSNPYGLALSGNNLYVVNYISGGVGEYNATTGSPINANFITGLHGPSAIAISGNDLFVANAGGNTVGEYNATTGAAINSNFITGVSGPGGLAIASPVPEPTGILTGLLCLGLATVRRRRSA